jgi:transposase-like protein
MAQARTIYHAADVPDARERLDAFSDRWRADEPRAINSLRRNFGKTLVHMQFEKHLWKTIRTTNPVERYQEEVRGRIRKMRSFADDRSCEKMRSFADDRSCERIIYAIVAGDTEDMRR